MLRKAAHHLRCGEIPAGLSLLDAYYRGRVCNELDGKLFAALEAEDWLLMADVIQFGMLEDGDA